LKIVNDAIAATTEAIPKATEKWEKAPAEEKKFWSDQITSLQEDKKALMEERRELSRQLTAPAAPGSHSFRLVTVLFSHDIIIWGDLV
jgi:hypothetical protein